MYNDIEWWQQGNQETCIAKSSMVFWVCSKIRARTLVVSWVWIRQDVVRNSRKQTIRRRDDVTDIMMLNFSESEHPFFRGSSVFERGDLKSKGNEQLSLHFNGSDETVEVILRTVISVNQLSVYEAVADMCGELAWEISRNSRCRESLVAWESGNHGNASKCRPQIKFHRLMQEYKENLLREYEQKFGDLPEHVQLTKLCSNAGLAKTVEKGQYFTTFDDEELDRQKGSCREYTLPGNGQSSQVKGWILGNTKIGPSWMWWSVIIKDVTELKSWLNLYLETRLVLGFGSWPESTST